MFESACSLQAVMIPGIVRANGTAKIDNAELQATDTKLFSHTVNTSSSPQLFEIAALNRCIPDGDLGRISERNEFRNCTYDAAVRDQTIEAGAALILVEYPVGLNNNFGSRANQDAQRVPLRSAVPQRIKTPGPKQIAKRKFRGSSRSPNLGRRMNLIVRLVGSTASCYRHHVFQARVPSFEKKYNVSFRTQRLGTMGRSNLAERVLKFPSAETVRTSAPGAGNTGYDCEIMAN